MSADLGALIPPLQPFAQALVDLAGRARVQPRVTSTLRSRTQQERLYRAFLRGETKYPVAPPGTSAHEYGFAFDMVAATAEDLHDLGTVWTQSGGVWSANDEVHFEYPGFPHNQLMEGTPAGGVGGVVERTVQAYEDIPWYISIFFPTWSFTTKDSFDPNINPGIKMSWGGRMMCRMGARNYC